MTSIQLSEIQVKIMRILEKKDTPTVAAVVKEVNLAKDVIETEVKKMETYVNFIPKKGQSHPKYSLTEAGKQWLNENPAPEPAKKGKRKTSIAQTTKPDEFKEKVLADLKSILETQAKILAMLEVKVNPTISSAVSSESVPKATRMQIEEFQALLRKTTTYLEQRLLGGPIFEFPLLFDELKKFAPSLTVKEFHEALLELERKRIVDLQIANDPTRADRELGIWIGNRGLLYYMSWR